LRERTKADGDLAKLQPTGKYLGSVSGDASPAEGLPRVVIVGAGASGALMTAHLLRLIPAGLCLTIVEKRERLGRGLAYGASNPGYLLNVRAANMSAFADDPEHFWRWLAAQGEIKGDDDRFRFVPRSVYGRYLESLIVAHARAADGSGVLTVLRDEVREVRQTAGGVELALSSGGRLSAEVAILACGHEGLAHDGPLHLSPWSEPVGGGAPPDSTILILGTGLTMVDTAAALLESGHQGRIVALSRRGLIPQGHRDVEPSTIDVAAVPSDRGLAGICQWLRELARRAEARGGDWRSVIDGLRPHTQAIWRTMPPGARRRFLEHARPWWDVHRHRMAPEIAARLRGWIDCGRVEILAGRIVEIAAGQEAARVSLRRRVAVEVETIEVSRIIACKGVTSDPRHSANPLVESLFDHGLARADPLGIGIDVGPDCAIIDRQGRASQRLFAIGPMSQAAFWEIIAVPDIRLQTARLAAHLAAELAPKRRGNSTQDG
jgi:uncharacterized NAD(P)/FAD-binding protein YdhS